MEKTKYSNEPISLALFWKTLCMMEGIWKTNWGLFFFFFFKTQLFCHCVHDQMFPDANIVPARHIYFQKWSVNTETGCLNVDTSDGGPGISKQLQASHSYSRTQETLRSENEINYAQEWSQHMHCKCQECCVTGA